MIEGAYNWLHKRQVPINVAASDGIAHFITGECHWPVVIEFKDSSLRTNPRAAGHTVPAALICFKCRTLIL